MLAPLLVALSQVVLAAPEGARQPQLAVLDREVYVVYGTKDAVHVSISKDEGATFGPSRKIADVGALALGLRRGPRIAVKGGVLLVTAIAGKEGRGRDEDLLAWRSTDRGETWTSDGKLNPVAGAAREGLHALAAGPTGIVFCAWIDLSASDPRVCGASSPGKDGAPWSEPTVVFADAAGICPCCAPSVAIDEHAIWVMWRGVDHGSRDMVLAYSKDRGQTFSPPRKIGQGTWKLDACPMDGGGIDVAERRVRSVWRRESSVFLAEIGVPERLLGEGLQPSIVLGKDGPYVAWIESRGGPLLLLSPRAKEPVRLDERACDPALAAGPTQDFPVFAAWESGSQDAPKLVVARLDGK